jgi:tetratricopeptide (TPR) repeat protein
MIKFVDAIVMRGYCRFKIALYEENSKNKFDLVVDKALEDFNKAINLDPKNSAAYLYRGMTKSLTQICH